MLTLNKIHHIAIICSNYQKSKHFYTEILGLTIIQEIFREDRQSFKLDLALNGIFTIELFSFENAPKRTSAPEACGLRHLAFEVNDIQETRTYFTQKNRIAEEIRIDIHSKKQYFFIADPDDLPIEFYEL